MRNDKRTNDTSRRVNIIPNFMPNAAGSCLIETGRTRVLCTATVTHTIPTFRPDNMGWLTAEYSMLPGSTVIRKARERLKSDSRSIEIQRLIGRSLRSIVDLSKLPGITIRPTAEPGRLLSRADLSRLALPLKSFWHREL